MFDFCIKGVKVRLHFGFFAVIAIMLLQGGEAAMTVLLCCMLHESGHLLAMRICGLRAHAFDAYSGGMRISTHPPPSCLSLGRELLVLFAGCAANLLTGALFALAGMNSAAAISLALCVFNLPPVSSLDGANALKAIAIRFCSPETEYFLEELQLISGVIFTLLVTAAMIRCGSFNITLPLTVVLMLWESAEGYTK